MGAVLPLRCSFADVDEAVNYCRGHGWVVERSLGIIVSRLRRNGSFNVRYQDRLSFSEMVLLSLTQCCFGFPSNEVQASQRHQRVHETFILVRHRQKKVFERIRAVIVDCEPSANVGDEVSQETTVDVVLDAIDQVW